MMNFNPMQLIQTLQRQAGNNPVMNNALQMIQKGDIQGLEQMARNLCKERGIDPEKALSQLQQQFGIK